MRKYGESKTARIMMAAVPYATSGSGLRKFRADGFLLDRVYVIWYYEARDMITKLSVTSNNRVCVPELSIPGLNPRFHRTDCAVF